MWLENLSAIFLNDINFSSNWIQTLIIVIDWIHYSDWMYLPSAAMNNQLDVGYISQLSRYVQSQDENW